MPNVVYFFFMSSLACLSMCYIPSLAYLSGIVWGISLLLGGRFLNDRLLILMLGFNLLLLFGLSGSSNLFFILIFGFPAFTMGRLLLRNRTYYQLQKWGMLTVVVLVSLYIGTAYNAPGFTSPAEREEDINQYIEESLELYQDSGLVAFYEQQGISPEDMKNDLVQAARWMFAYLPAFFYMEAILAVYLVLVLAELISRGQARPIAGRKPFREEQMPWQLVGLVIMALVLWLWGREEMNSLYYVGGHILLVAFPIAIYYGLANLAYALGKQSSNLRRWILIIGFTGAMLFVPTMIFVALLGLFDSLLDYRKLNHVKEDPR